MLLKPSNRPLDYDSLAELLKARFIILCLDEELKTVVEKNINHDFTNKLNQTRY